MPQPLLVYFRFFFSGIRARIVGVEGEHADHLTAPQPYPVSFQVKCPQSKCLRLGSHFAPTTICHTLDILHHTKMAISFSFHSLFHFLSFSFSFSFSFPLSLTLFISFFLFFFILYLSLSLSLSLLLFVIVYHLTLCTYDRYMYNLFLCISDCVCLQVYLLPVLHRGPLVL